jgi:hypothetical protein
MTAFCILAIAMVAGLSVVTDPLASVGMPSKAVFSEPVRSVLLNFSDLGVLVQEEETFVVDVDIDFTPLAVVTPVILQEEVQKQEEETVASLDAPLFLPTQDEDAADADADATSSTTGGPFNYCFEFASSLWQDVSPRLQESYDFASSLWQNASHRIAYSNEQVSGKYGAAIQVSKFSLHIFSTRFSVTLESGIVNDSSDSSV